jgi:two-component system LytT family response regulator
MLLRVFVVDDEPLAREGLVLRLEKLDTVTVDGSFGRAQSALDALRVNPPDLLFLDVSMPGLDGFDMLDRLPQSDAPAVIFVTAHEEYAVRAFEKQAVDYLLKPVSENRLSQAVEQARKRIHQQQVSRLGVQLRGLLNVFDASTDDDVESEVGSPLNRIAVRGRGRVMMIRPREIDYVEGAGDYVEFHVGDETHLHRATMQNIEKRLAPHGFQRIHRSMIVNLACVRSLRTDPHGAYYVCLESGARLKLSRSYREAFEQALGTSF